MQLASIVSERFGFAIPRGYVRMAEAGILSATAQTAKKKTTKKKKKKSSSKVKTKTRARALGARALATTELHWLTAQEIVARLERHGGRASWRPRWPANFVFVPFAENYGGDEWGWAPSLGEPGANEPPVIFIAHDTEDTRIVAPTFASFLFRMTLEALSECPHDGSHMSLGERIAQMRASARAVLDFLPAELSARLDRVLDLPVRKVTVRTLREKSGKFFRVNEATHLSLVASDWAARIVREELEDPRLDQPLRIDS